MASNFAFKAKDPSGKIVSGTVTAKSDLEVRARLKAGGYHPLTVDAAKAKPGSTSGKVKSKDLQIFMRQMSVLLKSGVPLADSLESLSDSAPTKGFSDILKKVLNDVEQGRPLSDALSKFPKVFDEMMVNLTRAGEQAGILEEIFDRVSVYYEKRNKLKSKVVGALIYPIITLVISFAAFFAILIFVIPKFQSLFSSQGKELPMLTQKVVGLSDFFILNWYTIFPTLFAIPFFLSIYYKTPNGKRVLDNLFLKVPLFGSLIRRSAIARMSRTVSTLLRAGVMINDALEVTFGTTGNVIIEDHLRIAQNSILAGKSFSEPLRQSGFFPKIVTQMIVIGEQTGNMDEMLEKVADFYEDEVENTASQLTALIEPFVIVFLGGMIGTLVIAMFLPIMSMGDAFL